ncbi:hypothetical protein [Piscinibacter sakaiensis]|uniref:hypothetical protein n=1 Tax=Piscinibacter sakaiensis TaxID=1547922 RepID=UPI003AACBB22
MTKNKQHRLGTEPTWQSLVIVCRACAKRSKGPKGFTAKSFAGEARRTSKDVRPRPRIILSTCLGLCPKKAQAVAVVGAGGGLRIAAMQSLDDAANVPDMLRHAAAPAGPAPDERGAGQIARP